MIGFPCPCRGYVFTLPDDMAGSAVQCPYCRRLVDIPRADEVAVLENDGSYRVDPGAAPASALTGDAYVEHAKRIYGSVRAPGSPGGIDLRPSLEDVRQVGVPTAQMTTAVPHYDPMTGELVRPVEVKAAEEQQIDVAAVPTARAIGRPKKRRGPVDKPAAHEFAAIWLKIFRPESLVVISFFLAGQVVALGFTLFLGMGMFFVAPVWLIIEGLLLAHFANVIDHTGPGSGDELPAPIRGFSWHEDTGGPFIRLCTALMLCYGPSLLLIDHSSMVISDHLLLALAAALAVVGSLLFPATLLTATTSGAIANLRPDRIMGTISVLLGQYPIVLLTGIPALFIFFIGLWGVSMIPFELGSHTLAMSNSTEMPWGVPIALWTLVSSTLFLVGTYLMHVFCWQLGILYRQHHEHFPWLFQRHDKSEFVTPPARFAVVTPPHAPATRGPGNH